MLNVLLWAPLVAGVIAVLVPRVATKWIVLLGTVVTLGLAIGLVGSADEPGLHFVVDESWIPDLGVSYSLGVDGISVFLILMTAILWTAATLFSAFRVPDRPRLYFFMLGLAETATLGAFLAQDLLLFVLFFDLMLVPFMFLVIGWGGPERRAAAIKFVVYTLVGSLLMLAAAVALAVLASPEEPGADSAKYQDPPADECGYRTFCGT